MLEEECPAVGGVEEVCPVWEVDFLLLVSVQRAGCFAYCHLAVPFSFNCECGYLAGVLGLLTGTWLFPALVSRGGA